jgi:hypothetical protein
MKELKKQRQKKLAPTPWANLPQPSEREAALISESRERSRARRARVSVKWEKRDGKTASVGPHHNDGQGWLARLDDAFGSPSDAFGISQLNALSNALRTKEGEVDNTALNAALAVVDGVRPSNEIEAMLAGQMAITHSLAMEMLGRARRVYQIPQVDCAGNLAVKLLRTYTAQTEALAKLRRGGEQVVRVEHVHVHPGAQAIVGNVSQGTGGGALNETGEQPHAKPETAALAYAPVSPMRSQDTAREPVPVASGEREETVPDARGSEGIGSTDRKAKR